MEKLFSNLRNKNQLYGLNLNKTLQNQKAPRFVLNGSGCRQKAALMQLPVFRIAVCIGFLALQQQASFSIMITASHNSAAYNGIKIGYTNGEMIKQSTLKTIQGCLNSNKHFQEFICFYQKLFQQTHSQNLFCYVGRDCRTSSPYLSQVVCSTLRQFSFRVVDVGICTTPELYSFAKYISLRIQRKSIVIQNGLNIEQLKRNYVDQVLLVFQSAFQKVQKSHQKRSILLDFSNGSGAVSYLNYKLRLQKFFQFTETFDSDFSQPNNKCGAHYFYENWDKVLLEPQFNKFSECFFFDGDSDRIIAKIGNQDTIFDGNFFMVFYLNFFKKAIIRLVQQKIILPQDEPFFQLHGIGTVVMNQGTKIALSKLGIRFNETQVGVIHLQIQTIKKTGISVFFEPSGHGGIYYSTKAYETLNRLSQENQNNLELCLMIALFNILQNNLKGDGIHNMLAYLIIKEYLQLPNMASLIELRHQQQKNLHFQQKYDSFFKNDEKNLRSLSEPVGVQQFINQTCLNLQFQAYVRKSNTQRGVLRVIVQGMTEQICRQAIDLIQKHLRSHQYLAQPQKSTKILNQLVDPEKNEKLT